MKNERRKEVWDQQKKTAFNDFMQIMIPKVKAENPEMKHKDAFGKAAALWATAKENPKNR